MTESDKTDITQAIPLMAGVPAQACLADKEYDSDAFLAWLHERHIQPGGHSTHSPSERTKAV